jgi:peptide deformylase
MQLEQGMARLAQHEIDHLHGILYSDRMPPNRILVPVSQYQGSGSPWEY